MLNMPKEKDALTQIKGVFVKQWEAINRDIQKLNELDDEKLLLNIQARKILGYYLDKFKELSLLPLDKKNIREISRLLDSLKYLVKVLLKLGKKKRPLS
jgi:hypothetical protein